MSSAGLSELAYELKNVTAEIASLDLSDETAEERLVRCQARQESLRRQIERLTRDGLTLPASIKSVLAECMELETEIANKLTEAQNQVRQQLQQLSNGKKMSKLYHQEYATPVSVFYDHKS